MGGLGPGIGGLEILVIGLVALLVVGPKDLPVLMRRVGGVMAKARGMAADFRASFDEMARQSELDELRKEVEALRTGQGMQRLGAEADAAFKDIKTDLERPLDGVGPALDYPEGWGESAPRMMPLATPEPPLALANDPVTKPKPKSRRKVETAAASTPQPEPGQTATARRKPTPRKAAPRKPAS